MSGNQALVLDCNPNVWASLPALLSGMDPDDCLVLYAKSSKKKLYVTPIDKLPEMKGKPQ